MFYNEYRTLPKISRDDFELIFYELDDSHDVKVSTYTFFFPILLAYLLAFPSMSLFLIIFCLL